MYFVYEIPNTYFDFFFCMQISLFYVAVLAGLLQRFPFSWSQVWADIHQCVQFYYFTCFLGEIVENSSACVQHTTGQLRNRKSGSSSVAKETEHGESITFADVAGVDEAKEELEEIVVCNITNIPRVVGT